MKSTAICECKRVVSNSGTSTSGDLIIRGNSVHPRTMPCAPRFRSSSICWRTYFLLSALKMPLLNSCWIIRWSEEGSYFIPLPLRLELVNSLLIHVVENQRWVCVVAIRVVYGLVDVPVVVNSGIPG